MPAFELFQPTTIPDALALLYTHGPNAWVMAGGLDTFDWLKDRIKRPRVVIDISGIDDLSGVRQTGDGVEIGATTTLTQVVQHPLIREKYSILNGAAEAAASPQIRNQGTIGGNISQDTRCWYYRGGWDCYRAGGNTCYADTPTAINREHAIFGADRCVAVSPSDTAPALIALDAKVVLQSTRGERVLNIEDYFIGPGTDITRMNVLKPNELLTAIRLPGEWSGASFYFEKVADRKVWDFPLMNVASALVAPGGTIKKVRLAVNGAAARPMRLVQVEQALIGKPCTEETADMAGKLAVRGALPLAHNAYKIPLMRNLVKRAVRESGAVALAKVGRA
jgi:xanthine dehydrogenase YagS FAD-binding subunit